MNKKISSHVQYTWWLYLVIALVIVISWTTIFNGILQPENNEKVSIIFYSQNGWDSLALYTQLNNSRKQITQQNIETIIVEQCATNKTTFFQRVGADIVTSDILVIDLSLLDDSDGQKTLDVSRCFYEIDQAKISQLFVDVTVDYYIVDGKAYGIYLNNDDAVVNNFEKHYQGNYKFVLFFSRYSVNLDMMNNKGNQGDTAALDVVRYLLEQTNEMDS